METREESRRRNNKVIFLTAGVILMLTLLSLQKPDGTVVTINIGDSSFQVANTLSKEGISFSPLVDEKGEGIRISYTPVSAFDRLHKKGAGSYYEILFREDKVFEIVWYDKQGNELGRRLFIKAIGPPR